MPEKAIQISADKATELAQRIIADVTQADSDRAVYLEQLDTDRELLLPRQTRENPPFEGASELHMPTVRTMRDQLVSRYTRTLLTSDPAYQVEAYTGAERDYAQRVEKYLQLLITEVMNLPRSYRSVFQGAVEDGAAVALVTWRTEKRKTTRYTAREEPVLDEFGYPATDYLGQPIMQRVIAPEQQEVTDYDAPHLRYIDIRKFGTYPAATADVQRSTGVYCRFTQTGDELLRQVKAGEYEKAAIEKVKGWNSDNTELQTADETARDITGNTTDLTFQSRQYDILECYWRYAKDESTLCEDWLITIHEPSYTVLRAIPNPWWHGKRPFVLFRGAMDKFGILGDSLGDVVGPFQRNGTTMVRLLVDGTAKTVAPPMVAEKGALVGQDIDIIERQLGPGKFVELQGSTDALKPLLTNFSPQATLPALEFLRSTEERATGVGSTQMGVANSRDMTATEVGEMLAEGSALLSMRLEDIAASMDEVAWFILQLSYQFIGNEGVQKAWMQANGETIQEEMQDPSYVPGLEELSREYKVRSAGTTETSNRALRAKRAMELYPVMFQNPLVQRDPMHVYALTSWLLNETDSIDPVTLLGTEEEVQQWWQQQQQAMAMQAQAQAQQELQSQQMAQQGEQQERQGMMDERKQGVAEQMANAKMQQMQAQAMQQPV